MGMIKGFGQGVGDLLGRGYNRLESNFLDASDNSLFFGSRSQRERLVGGKNQIGEVKRNVTDARRNYKEEVAMAREMAPDGADGAAFLKQQMKDSRTVLNGAYQDNARAAIGYVGDMGSSVGSYFAGADRAGQGWNRAAAIGTRAGMAVGGSLAVGTGMRYASGGTFTQNRKGERDIAGIPFI